MKKICIIGAAGFLGSHLEHRLKAEGHYVVSIVRQRPQYRKSVADELDFLDLTNTPDYHHHFFRHYFDECYQLAADSGGLTYIGGGENDSNILTNSVKMNLYTLEAIRKTQAVGKIFFASSQCVYPELGFDPFAQERVLLNACQEKDADFNTFAFGQEKLFSEKLYDAYSRNHGISIAIARFGNTYGPFCRWQEPWSKVVAALCRKVAQASYASTIDVIGDGKQTRSFTYVDDAIEGMLRLMASDYDQPVNIAHPGAVSINELLDAVSRVSGKIVGTNHIAGPVGVRTRSSDNSLCRKVLDWEPETGLHAGLPATYTWIRDQVLTRETA